MHVLCLPMVPRELNFMGAMEQMTKQAAFLEVLSAVTKAFLRPVIVGSTHMKYAKYVPSRTGGGAPGCPLAAAKTRSWENQRIGFYYAIPFIRLETR